MSRIDDWLDRFRTAWLDRDVDAVMALFADGADYRETPFRRLDRDEMREEWTAVREQEDIDLALDVFSRDPPRYAVRWDLSYTRNREQHHWRGVYLIELAEDGCVAFTQVGEEEPGADG